MPAKNASTSTSKSGKGSKGGKGAKGVKSKRRRELKDEGDITGINRPALQRFARFAGIWSIKDDVYDKATDHFVTFVTEVMNNAALVTTYRGRKTIKTEDIQKGFDTYMKRSSPIYMASG